MDFNALNSQFGEAGQFVFELGSAGQPQVRIHNAQAEAVIVLQGAHLVHWQPTGEQPVIWLSEDATFKPGKSIRGGVPVCWPWFGPHESDASFPAHGFARMQPWTVTETASNADGSGVICFRLAADASCDTQWPYASQLEMRFTIGK
ncbi:MAG: D-hexose-6-phosphate mutarotase, partial [Gammaproteobacteria bacterium]|nr:D-hexose-6-phosphate mutarotase [Gammaproteobacteria bacterium]